MYGVFSSELLALKQMDNSISDDLVENKSYEFERQYEKNVKPLLQSLTSGERENYCIFVYKQGIRISCDYYGWMASDVYPYLRFKILFEDLEKIKTMYDLFKYQEEV